MNAYNTLRDTTDLTPEQRATLLATVATSVEDSYYTLRFITGLTPEERAPLLAKVATSAEYSYHTLCNTPDLTPEQRAPLLATVATSVRYSYYTLGDNAGLTPAERAPLLTALHTTPITQAQSALMRRVMDKINNEPTCWYQGTWHCGTSHCFAGHVEGEVHGEWESSGQTRDRAQEALGLSDGMADALFEGSNTLEQLNEYVDYLTNGAE